MTSLPSVSQATANVNSAIAATSTPVAAMSEFTNVEQGANNLGYLSGQDWTDVNTTGGELSSVAAAFQQMFQQGSPVAAAQNAILAANTARQALATGQTQGNAMNATAQAGQQEIANSAQQQAAMGSAANQSQTAVLAAQLQQLAINAQITQQNAKITLAKQQLLTQAQQSAQGTLLSQQSMANSATAEEQQIQLGQTQANFNNWMTGVATLGSIGSGAAATGSKLGVNTNSLSTDSSDIPGGQASSDQEEANIPDYTNDVTDMGD